MLYKKLVYWTFEELMTGYLIVYKRGRGDLDPRDAINHPHVDSLGREWNTQYWL